MTALRALLAALAIGLVAPGLTGCSGATTNCNDGADNDGDGLIDSDDPGCALNGDAESPDPNNSACADAVDNDGDGLIDTEDPGCDDLNDDDEYNEPIAGCRDGLDNDGDGLIDFPNDPGCTLTLEDDESDDCPNGPNCPACSNGSDDDGDGQADYPDDLGCDSAADQDEFNADPTICGAAVSLQPLPVSMEVMGSVDGMGGNELISPDCGGSGTESVYIYEPTEPVAVEITTDFPETNLDTVVYLREDCRLPETEIGCNDDDGVNVSRLLIPRLEPGTYYIIIDAHSTAAIGDYRMRVNEFVPVGEECVPEVTDCAPGLVCRNDGSGAPMFTCEPPRCNDGENNDADAFTDYPDDPGCETPEDNDELDDCPTGDDCPQCSNDEDDDLDTFFDYPDDPGCTYAADDNEIDECIPGVEVIPLTGLGAAGTTSGPSMFVPSCTFGSSSSEDVYAFLLNRSDVSTLRFSTIGSSFDTITSVRFDDCGSNAAEIACEDPRGGGEVVELADPAEGTYYVFVDGSFGSGDYILDVEIVVEDGSDCTGDGVVCEPGFACRAGTCQVAECNDGNNNDGGGGDDSGENRIDYPADPGCESISDDDESDNCTGTNDPSLPPCPACGNGMDDDGDGLDDYDPNNDGNTADGDPGCMASSDNLELDECSPGVQLAELTDAGVVGQTPPSGSGSDYTPTCHTSTLSTEDEYAYLNTRNLDQLIFSTVGSPGDTVLYVRSGDSDGDDMICGDIDDEIACEQEQSSGEEVIIDNPDLDEFYFVFVDGDFTSGIDYVLNVRGRLPGGATCDPGDTQFTCAEGWRCNGSTCVRTQCNSATDNDGDGDGGMFPDDPGCINLDDNDESDDCGIDGPNCPQCGNGDDDDGDGLTDYDPNGDGNPADGDPGCEFAADNLELDDCIADVPLTELTDAGTTGTTPPSGSGSDFTPSCHSSSLSTEDEYAYLNTRNLRRLTFSTVGSTGDTVLAVREGTCGDIAAEVGCANTQNGGEIVTVTDPMEDEYYYVFVDGDFTSGIDYVLDVSGVLEDGEACSPGNTQFVCDTGAGSACNGSICAPAACGDGDDNDGDGDIDAADPGCLSSADNDETDPGTLPNCGDGLDNSDTEDTLADFPNDPGCLRASDQQESNCPDSDPRVYVTSGQILGTTAGTTSDFDPSCSPTSAAGEIVHELYVPTPLNSLTIDTNGSGFDTVLYVTTPVCSAAKEIECDDDGGDGSQSLINIPNTQAGTYHIFVDGFGTNTGSYILNVHGEIPTGGSCETALISTGLFSCQGNSTCTNGTCQ